MMVCWFVSVAFVHAAAAEKVSWVKRTFGELTWDEVKVAATTPREVCLYVRHRISPVDDVSNRWPTGKEAWDKKSGDCRSFASCVVALCQEMGLEAEVRVLYPKGAWEGHAIVTGSWKGQLWMASNGWYQAIKSVEAGERDIARQMGWGQRQLITSTREEMESGKVRPPVALRVYGAM